jgi:hypothetical protein
MTGTPLRWKKLGSIAYLLNNENFIDHWKGDGNSTKFDTIVEDLQEMLLMKDNGHAVTYFMASLFSFFETEKALPYH